MREQAFDFPLMFQISARSLEFASRPRCLPAAVTAAREMTKAVRDRHDQNPSLPSCAGTRKINRLTEI